MRKWREGMVPGGELLDGVSLLCQVMDYIVRPPALAGHCATRNRRILTQSPNSVVIPID
jgi:hypothetical protein